jgi:hypothetical protein
MFLASKQAGDFGGVTSGDAICEADASEATLGGVWRALLGSSPAQARALFQGPGPFVAVSAGSSPKVIFATHDGLSGPPLTSLDVDATGAVVAPGEAWSGVSARCNGWQSASDNDQGTVMSITPSGGDGWLDIGPYPCSSHEYVVCLEQ